jgi:16S rRNA (cytosine967-C5)-methyltransferase
MGIKAGQIGLRLRGGAVAAFDRSPAKIVMLLRETARLRVGCVRAACADAEALPLGPSSSFERILVDAPCTGTGSMARKPDIRHRLKASDPARLSGLQGRILEGASRHLRGGGVLVYSVCSLLPEEGIGVVEKFLGRSRAFEMIIPPGLPPSLAPVDPRGGLLLLPSVHGTEGFFIAAMTKSDLRLGR